MTLSPLAGVTRCPCRESSYQLGPRAAACAMRNLAVLGIALVAIMQLVFALTSGDRPFPYREVQVVSIVGTLVLAWGVARGRTGAMVAGAAVDLVTRVLQPLLGLTRLPLWLNLLFSLGWAWMVLDAGRGRAPRAGLWVLGLGHALAMLTAGARMTAFLALGLGAIGFFLAAPNVAAGPPDAQRLAR